MDIEVEKRFNDFLHYICENNKSVCVTLCDRVKQANSLSEFSTILKEKVGKEYACLLDTGMLGCNYRLMIYNEKLKVSIGYIYAAVTYGFWRGDIDECMLNIKYAIVGNCVYINGEKAACIISEEQIAETKDGIYVIDRLSQNIKKYVDGKPKWETKIPRKGSEEYKFSCHLNYPTDDYPTGLIAITEISPYSKNLYHFYAENGEFYGHTVMKHQYELAAD